MGLVRYRKTVDSPVMISALAVIPGCRATRSAARRGRNREASTLRFTR